MYKQIAIGIDQSYKNTGISVIADSKIKDIKSIRLDTYTCNSIRRSILKGRLLSLLNIATQKSDNIACIIERTRIHGGENSFINVDVIKSMGSLSALIVDVMYQYGISVYSVDTRAWKSQVIGTTKPEDNILGVTPQKYPTVRWVISQGFEDKILLDVTSTRQQKGTFIRNGRKYKYNDDASDSAAIGMYWFVGDHNKLTLER